MKDPTLITVFAAEAGEPPPEWHKPQRGGPRSGSGRPPTTNRHPARGGREIRARVSAAEYEEAVALADERGATVPGLVRELLRAAATPSEVTDEP